MVPCAYPADGTCPGARPPSESPQAALERKLREEVGAGVDLAGRAPEFRLAGDVDETSLWVIRAWRGELLNLAREEHGDLGWFAAEEIGSLELADPRYLGVLSTLRLLSATVGAKHNGWPPTDPHQRRDARNSAAG